MLTSPRGASKRTGSPGNYRVIINPHARNGRAAADIERLRREFTRAGLRGDFVPCAGLADATRLARAALESGFDHVVAVGGDGTINAVLNGFFGPDGARISTARFGVVHVGTSPDFSRSYGVPLSVEEAVETLRLGVTRLIRPGRILLRHDINSTVQQSAYFACCANIGLGAAVAAYANSGIRRRVGDVPGTFLSVLRAISCRRTYDLRVELDGNVQILQGVTNLSIGKTRHVASGLKVAHALSADDRRFYVLCVRDLTTANVWGFLWRLYRGSPLPSVGRIALTYGERIRVASLGSSVEVEYDGDPGGWCPCEVEPAAEPIPLLVKENHDA